MENCLTMMKFNDLDITIYGTHEDPLFKAKDIGELLGIKDINSTIRDFDSDSKAMLNILTLGGNQMITCLKEQGLYKIMMISRKPIAKTFQKWVFSAIKEIRLTGKYELQRNLEKDKKLIREKTLIDSYHKKPVMYLGGIGKIDGEDLIKFGYTNDIKTRNNDHKREIGEFYTLEYIVECEQNIELEKRFKEHNDISNRRVTKTINGKVQTELIRMDDYLQNGNAEKILTKIKQTLHIDKEYALSLLKHEETMKALNIEEEKMKHNERMKEMELKELETKERLKLMDIEILKIQKKNEINSKRSSKREQQLLGTSANLKEIVNEYIVQHCDFIKFNSSYRMSSEKMFHSFSIWRDTHYKTEYIQKKDFVDFVNELTGNTKLPRIRINGHKIHGWYGIQFKTS